MRLESKPQRTRGLIAWYRQRQHAPFVVSSLIHVVILCGLAFYVIPMIERDGFELLLTGNDSGESAFETFSMEVASEPAPIPVEPNLAIDVMASSASDEIIGLTPVIPGGDRLPIQEVTAAASSESSATSTTSVEQALDRVTQSLRGQLMHGDLLVVWMVDASESLVDDRPRVAERLIPFFDEITTRVYKETGHRCASALISFGSKMKEHVAPTLDNNEIVRTLEQLPVDRTGKEQLFAAVEESAAHYRKVVGAKQVTLVVWTDESGDDVDRLERAIESCQKSQTTVHIIGPSAALGTQQGFHVYHDPKSQEQYQLPVLRGPDSAEEELLELGYWYFTLSPVRERRSRRNALPTWYGNVELRGMLSSFSPFALTRLTLATQGTYTILDSPDDQGPFDHDRMQAYAPEYASAEVYRQQFEHFPLRAAVHRAVSFLDGKHVDEPNRMFFIRRFGERQFDFDRLLQPPGQFHSKYRAAVRSSLQQAARAKRTVDEALAFVSHDGNLDQGMDSEYREEPSLRWKAWYDLTRGRLLAFHVRLEEFRIAAEATLQAGGLDSATNHVVFIASQSMRSSVEFQHRGEEARRLLQRCIDQNLDTPWAYLADREMAHALGVEAEESTLTPSRLSPTNASPSLPRF